MAIDADLNAGLIDEQTAKQRRQDIIAEANFYGAMDGSSKFIKGDAVAGIIITIINIIGGFLIGAFQHDMEIKDAAATYTILTIGDGLVSQIPGLITSTATAIIITRASKDEDNFAEGVVSQLLGEYKTLLIVGFILFVFALVPGLPTFSLGFMGLLFLGIGFILKMIEEGKIDFSAVKTDKNSSQQAGNGNKAAPSANKLPKKSEEEIALEEQAKIDDILKIEILELDLGYGLLKLADGDLVERIRAMRRNMATMLGFLMPKIRLRDNILLGPNEYKFKLKGVVIGSGVVYPDKCLAMDSGYVSADIDGIAVKDPAFGLDALWIDQNYKEDAILSGYTVADAASVISTHMSELVKQNASELLTKQEVQNILEKVKTEYSVVVDDALKIVGVGVIQKVLKALLKDNIPIKDMLSILEAISDVAEVSKNLDMIIEHVRAALARVITSIYTDENSQLNFYILEAPAQQKLIDSLSYKDGAYTLMINVAQTSAIVSALRAKRENRPISEQGDMVLCVEPSIRKFIANIVQNFSIDIAVLSFAEIAPNTQFETLGTIEIPEL
jgi:flagellar biosynthesis protein FlhA